MRFYLGTHLPVWLERLNVPLFVSHRRLGHRKRLPVAITRWALDSGGFSELTMYGKWRTEPADYIDAVRRYMTDIGKMDWAAPMDWMCEPHMLAKTGLSVDRHQGLTVENLSLLREHAPEVPFIPVLQGWVLADYLACIDRYARQGIYLAAEPVVGVGSVCRRQDTAEIGTIFRELKDAGINCHGFGVKSVGLGLYGRHLVSADSMAWSYEARRNPPLPGCSHGKTGTGNCANCPIWAMAWRERVLARMSIQQPDLWEGT